MTDHQVRIVCIGCSFGGVALAKGLNGSSASLQLVDRRDFIEVIWAAVRSGTVEPELCSKTLIPHEALPAVSGKVLHDEVVGITDSAVRLKSGKVLPYDQLVFAHGASNPSKGVGEAESRLEGRRAALQASAAEVKQAKSVLIVGGGPTGVETAAEIADAMPDKRVTLVHSRSHLLSKSPAVGAKAQRWLESKGVRVILNDKVESMGGTYRTAKSGETLAADRVIWCHGNSTISSWLQAEHGDILNERGQIKVDQHLRVQGRSNWWALGDCNDVKEEKQGYFAVMQAAAVAKSIKAMIQQGPDAKLAVYKPFNGMEMQAISLGRRQGILVVRAYTIWSFMGFIPTWIKSKDLLVGKTRSDFGVK